MASRTPSPSAPLERPHGLEFSNYYYTGGASQTEFHTTISADQRQERENLIRLVNLVLRSAGLISSFLSSVTMAANIKNKSDEEFRYSLAIVVIVFVYLLAQLSKGIYDAVWGYKLFHKILVSYINFIGDQTLAYLVISCSSSMASRMNRDLRDMAVASVSMSFITFAVLAASSILSALVLAKQISWF